MGGLSSIRDGIAKARYAKSAVQSDVSQVKNNLPKPKKFGQPKKSQNVSSKKLVKNRIATSLGIVILFSMVGTIGISTINNLSVSYLFSSLVFMALGSIYLLLRTLWPVTNKKTLWPQTLTLVIFYLIGLAAFSLTYYWVNGSYSDNDIYLGVFSASTVAFLMPFFIGKIFNEGFAIPPKIYKPWFFPEHILDSTSDWDPRKVIFVNLVFTKDMESNKRTEVKSKFPLNAGLASIIYVFVDDYNHNRNPMDPIRDLSPYGWYFYVKRKLGKKVLDPELSVRENKLKENEKIYLERVIVD